MLELNKNIKSVNSYYKLVKLFIHSSKHKVSDREILINLFFYLNVEYKGTFFRNRKITYGLKLRERFFIKYSRRSEAKYSFLNSINISHVARRIEKFKKNDIQFINKECDRLLSDLFVFYCLYYSLDQYRPSRVIFLVEKWLKYLNFNKKTHYSWYGQTDNESEGNILAILHSLSYYFTLNEDWKRLEAHLIKYRDNISSDLIQEHILILSVINKNDPNPLLLSRAIIDKSPIKIKDKGKINDCLESNPFLYNYTIKNKDIYKLMDKVCNEFCTKHKEWFLRNYLNSGKKRQLQLVKSFHLNSRAGRIFDCSKGLYLKYPTKHYFFKKGKPVYSIGTDYANYRFLSRITAEIIKEFYNNIRDFCNIPRIGEGWIGEMALLNKLRSWFPSERIVHQWQPKWLGRQRIDIAFVDKSLAIEFHGTQHFKPVDYFGGVEAFKQQKLRDTAKINLCKRNKVNLLVFTENDSDYKIKKMVRKYIS